jgi:hypothetical protein
MARGVRLCLMMLAMTTGASRPAAAQFGGLLNESAARPRGLPVSLRLDRGSARIEEVLNTQDNWQFGERPLNEVVDALRKRFAITLYIDQSALDDEGIDPTLSVQWVNGYTTVESLLRLELGSLGLGIHVEDDVLLITTLTKIGETFLNRIYPVGDLMESSVDPDRDYDYLVHAIQQTTSGIWMDVDGTGGTIMPFPKTRSLIIRQTYPVHREIERLLLGLRTARGLQQSPSIDAVPEGFASRPLEPTTPIMVPTATPAPHPTVRSSRSTSADWRQPRVDRGR